MPASKADTSVQSAAAACDAVYMHCNLVNGFGILVIARPADGKHRGCIMLAWHDPIRNKNCICATICMQWDKE